MFNGSASLRDAAGALIENVTKATRRGTDVDEAFIEKTYEDVRSLYKLDIRRQSADKRETESSLPLASKILIVALAAAWAGIGFVFLKRRHVL